MKIIATVRSNCFTACPTCSWMPKATSDAIDAFNSSIDHFQHTHKLECLHVGTDTDHSGDKPLPITIAVFGTK